MLCSACGPAEIANDKEAAKGTEMRGSYCTLTVSGAAIKKHSVIPASAPDAYKLYHCPCGTTPLYNSFAENFTAFVPASQKEQNKQRSRSATRNMVLGGDALSSRVRCSSGLRSRDRECESLLCVQFRAGWKQLCRSYCFHVPIVRGF